jgi:phosphomevalonate kinase
MGIISLKNREHQNLFKENQQRFLYHFSLLQESTPEWAIELLKQHRDNTEKLRDEIRKKRSQLNKINDEMKTVNELLNYSDALMESATECLAQCNAEMESAVIEMEMGLERMNQIRKKIDETEASRAKTDQYWKDLISKEIQTRSKYRDGRS